MCKGMWIAVCRVASWGVVEIRGGRTYWFIKLVLPTPLSPSMITCAVGQCISSLYCRMLRPYFQQYLLSGRHLCGGRSIGISRWLRSTMFNDRDST